MVEVNFDTCKCTCEQVAETIITEQPSQVLIIGLVVLVVVLVIIGLIALSSSPKDKDKETYY